ncbi:hypothetical protein [Aliamphritea spongicola]|nr:hypothetical protein [Aliamphritea spongicola]
MQQITEDLWQSDKYSSGILNSHAYLLIRPGGNVLFYNTAGEGIWHRLKRWVGFGISC